MAALSPLDIVARWEALPSQVPDTPHGRSCLQGQTDLTFFPAPTWRAFTHYAWQFSQPFWKSLTRLSPPPRLLPVSGPLLLPAALHMLTGLPLQHHTDRTLWPLKEWKSWPWPLQVIEGAGTQVTKILIAALPSPC